MGFQAAHWIEANTDLTGNEYTVALVLAIACDDENGAITRRKSTLIKSCHVSERQLHYIMAQLNHKGIVVVGKRFAPNGVQLSNAYVLKSYVESVGMNVQDALDDLTAQELSLKLRPEQEPYDFSKNRKNGTGNTDDLPLFAKVEPLQANQDSATDNITKVGCTGCAPQGALGLPGEGAHPVHPYINSFVLTPSFNSLSPAADAAGTDESAATSEEDESLPFMEPAPKPRSRKARKPRAAAGNKEIPLKSRTAQVLSLYLELLGYEPASHGREARAAKLLGDRGWTDEQITECYRSLKAEPFWSNKHLSLDQVATNIAARMGTDGTTSKGKTDVSLNTNTAGRVQLARFPNGTGQAAGDAGAQELSADEDPEWQAYLAGRRERAA